MTARIAVLVVDDSAFARKVMRDVLGAESDIEVVGIARDGVDALEKISALRPDVVTLDLVMPELDGVGVLRVLAERADAPRAVVVTTLDDSSELGAEALASGAFELVQKPTAIASDRLYELGAPLVRAVRAAAGAVAPRPRRVAPPPPVEATSPHGIDLVVVGASTGGPQAIATLLAALPASFPVPIAVVLHMPVGYTASYADRIDRECALDVREAHEGLSLGPGQAAIARSGIHLTLVRDGVRALAHLDVRPIDAVHRPSVDVLFASAAEGWGPRVLGVVLTGMGDDGTAGARAIRARGGRVLAEAASSCVVYGMPRAVVESGLATGVVPLERMALAISAEVSALRGPLP